MSELPEGLDADEELPELAEFRLRVGAVELRQAALEARQVRVENMLIRHEGEHRSTNKLLAALNSRVDTLIEAVLGLASKSK